jgi:hypothetical protein
VGIEPTHQPWQGRRLPLHHTRIIKIWWTRQDSNLPHSACKADALPDELLAHLISPIHSDKKLKKTQTVLLYAKKQCGTCAQTLTESSYRVFVFSIG